MRAAWLLRGLSCAAAALLLSACGEDSAASDASGSGGEDGDGTPTGSGASGTGSGAGNGSGGGPGDSCGNGSCDDGETCASCDVDCCVPMFVATGLMGRSTVSCDDGHTWVADRSWDLDGDDMVCGSTQPVDCYAQTGECTYMSYEGDCYVNACDCLHHPGFTKGVAFGNGTFVATWGWGHPGSVRRSKNGVDWEATLQGEPGFGGVAFGAGHFVLSSRDTFWSADGSSWMPGGAADFQNPSGEIIWSVRRFGFADHDGGRFVAVASGGGWDMMVSSDAGASWWRPSVIPPECQVDISTYGDILYGDEVLVVVDANGTACRSADGGDTWTAGSLAGSEITVTSQGVWTGSEFRIWSDNDMYSSTDGQSWTATPMATPTRVGPVARAPNGTLVGMGNVWLGYAQQYFLRSTDGLTWESLPAGAFVPSHPIFYVTFGYGEPSETCPMPF